MPDPRAYLDMVLPAVKRLEDCADFGKTVQPYIPQLYDLPNAIAAQITNPQGLQHVYASTNPLIMALAFALFLTPLVLIVAEINRNYSQVDRLWSIIPVIYNVHYNVWARMNGLPTQRLDHVMAVSVLWGTRLTFNYWRRGGYQIGSEDYRWEVVKNYIGAPAMFVFNVVFISLVQNILLFLITTPTYVLMLASRVNGDKLSQYDTFFPRAMLVLVCIEFFADQQQWVYHKAKAAYQKMAKVPSEHKFTRAQLDRGFNTTGLWGWSRHPNFAAEQSVWVCLYQWGCMESWTYINWTFAGAFCYLCLFQASTWLTELLSAKKYPDYKTYQERVGKFLPKPMTGSMEESQSPKEKQKQKEKGSKADKGAKAVNGAKKR